MNKNTGTVTPAIEIEGVSVQYGSEAILKDIHLRVNTGEIISVIGPNGSGKTTLLKTIMGLKTFSSGKISVMGQSPRSAHKSGYISYLPQGNQLDNSFPVTVFDVVAMVRHSRKKWIETLTREDKRIIDETLDLMEIGHLKHRHYGSLSGGQKQKVLIARAVAFQPKIFFLDEPSTGLDVLSMEEFYRLIIRLRDIMGLTIMLVTHDIALISLVVDRVVYLNHEIHFFDKPGVKVPDEVIVKVFGKNMQVLIHDDHCITCKNKKRLI